jgi:3-hydroxymyristoyl/3-hydroxydecanoyl-(acyl carrier protein) dehydratase
MIPGMIDLNSVFHFDSASSESHGDLIETDWTLSRDNPYLNGHFPNQPVLPAVAILDANLQLLRKFLGQKISLRKLISAKFSSPLVPPMKIHIRLQKKSENGNQVIWFAEWILAEKLESSKPLTQMTFAVELLETASAAKA